MSQFEWKPAFGMADCAGAIANIFQEVFLGTDVFESIKLAKCYFHVKKGLEDNEHHFKSRENFEQLSFLVSPPKSNLSRHLIYSAG